MRAMVGLRSLLLATLLVIMAVPAMAAAVSWSRLVEPWPDPASLADIPGVPVSWPSTSPFAPDDIGAGSEDAPPTTALGRLYLPPGPHAARSVPAVILLHGSGGILPSRELTYAPQLARLGVAALVVDSFGARRDRGTEYLDRILNITETMILADAYTGLGFLAARPEIDPRHVVLTGFSYGAMSTMYGLYAQFAGKLAPPGLRFAGHVAFYGPCIARFDDSRTTGAPLLMLIGGKDELVDQRRCARLPRCRASMGRRPRTPPERQQSFRLFVAGRARRDDHRPGHRAGDERRLPPQAHPWPVHAGGPALSDRPRRPGAGPGDRRLRTVSCEYLCRAAAPGRAMIDKGQPQPIA